MNGDDIWTLDVDSITAVNNQNTGNIVIPQLSNIQNGQPGGYILQNGSIDKMVYNNSNSLIVKPEFRCNATDYEEIGFPSQPLIEIQGQEMLNEPKFDILPPKKKKNPAYVITNGSQLYTLITTKRKAAVKISLEMPISFKCNISLRYNDLVSNDKPVNICHAHQSEANIAAAPNTMFIVKGHNVNDVEYVDVNGHNCCIINSQGEYIIQFFCWNSCDKHRNHNKDMSIYVSFFDNDSGLISKTKKIKLRVAENVKRDAGIMESAKAKKRSIDYMMQDFVEPQILPKKFQVSQDEMEDPIPISPQPEAPTLICIEVNSKDQIELYSLQAKIFGNQMAILQDVLLKDLSD